MAPVLRSSSKRLTNHKLALFFGSPATFCSDFIDNPGSSAVVPLRSLGPRLPPSDSHAWGQISDNVLFTIYCSRCRLTVPTPPLSHPHHTPTPTPPPSHPHPTVTVDVIIIVVPERRRGKVVYFGDKVYGRVWGGVQKG